MIEIAIENLNFKKYMMQFLSQPEHIGFVFYLSAVRHFFFSASCARSNKGAGRAALIPAKWSCLLVSKWAEGIFFSAATACSLRAFSTQRWLAGLMCELSLTSRTLFKRTKFTKPARSAGQGRTDYPSLTCLGSLGERQRSWAHRSLAPTRIYCDFRLPLGQITLNCVLMAE